jgi:rare lipoprotein A
MDPCRRLVQFSRRSLRSRRIKLCCALLSALSFTACEHKQAKVNVPPPIEQPNVPAPSGPTSPTTGKHAEAPETISVPPDLKPIYTEVGIASWYGPPYHNRRGSNGEIYNMNAMTAAHRTLPLGSIVRVTNVKTGDSALVRITDRGPFIEGRILDLSLAAAKKVDVWEAGLAKVKLEVLETPAPLGTGGKWAVQVGAFSDEHEADRLMQHLARRYRTAKVLHFPSPTGAWWVRVRVLGDDKNRAAEVARDTQTDVGAVFLVRLD